MKYLTTNISERKKIKMKIVNHEYINLRKPFWHFSFSAKKQKNKKSIRLLNFFSTYPLQ